MNPRLTDVFEAIEGALELVFKLDKLRADLGAMSYDVARMKAEQKKFEERLVALATVDTQPSGRIADFGRSVSKERPEPPFAGPAWDKNIKGV